MLSMLYPDNIYFFLEVDFTSVSFYVFLLHYIVLKLGSGNTQNKFYL